MGGRSSLDGKSFFFDFPFTPAVCGLFHIFFVIIFFLKSEKKETEWQWLFLSCSSRDESARFSSIKKERELDVTMG